MNIHLHIERLVLDGLPVERGQGAHVQAAIEAELSRLFADRGVPSGLASGGAIPALDGGSFDVAPDARPDRIGVQVAQAVYGGLSR